MKTQHITKLHNVLIILCISVLSISCNTDDDSSNNDNSSNANFTAQVNGEAFNPEFVTGFRTGTPSTILVTGSMSDGEQIQLFIPTDSTTGTYSLNEDELSSIIAYYQTIDGDALDVTAFASTGAVTITEHNLDNQTLRATFNFTGTIENNSETYNITQGTFSVTYEDL